MLALRCNLDEVSCGCHSAEPGLSAVFSPLLTACDTILATVLKTSILPTVQDTAYASSRQAYTSLLSTLPAPSHPALNALLLTSLLSRLASSLSSPTPETPSTLLLTGVTSTRLASLMISQASSGKGYTLPLSVSTSFTHLSKLGQASGGPGVKEVRPLSGIGSKELGWYAWHRRLRTFGIEDELNQGGGPSEGKAKAPKSIERLTQGPCSLHS